MQLISGYHPVIIGIKDAKLCPHLLDLGVLEPGLLDPVGDGVRARGRRQSRRQAPRVRLLHKLA